MADELMTQPPPKHIRLASHNIERDLTEAVIFAAAFRFCSLAKKEKENFSFSFLTLSGWVRLIGSNEPLQLQLSLSLPPNTQTH